MSANYGPTRRERVAPVADPYDGGGIRGTIGRLAHRLRKSITGSAAAQYPPRARSPTPSEASTPAPSQGVAAASPSRSRAQAVVPPMSTKVDPGAAWATKQMGTSSLASDSIAPANPAGFALFGQRLESLAQENRQLRMDQQQLMSVVNSAPFRNAERTRPPSQWGQPSAVAGKSIYDRYGGYDKGIGGQAAASLVPDSIVQALSADKPIPGRPARRASGGCTGGGGGTGYPPNGKDGTGGSGIVILQIPTASYTGVVTGSPNVSTSGTLTIVKYTGSGTYSP